MTMRPAPGATIWPSSSGVNGQLVIPLLAEVAKTPAILDAVQSILGPNLLVWSVELFIKEPGDGKIVSWHQDHHLLGHGGNR